MKEEPLVTVVIPTYRRPALVCRAIESVRRQTHRNLEILVIDDASADNTEDVVRSITDARIRYIHHPKNKGVSAVRNTGIRAAGGDYVAFLDDDDEWRPDKLEKQLVAIDGHGAVLCAALVNGARLRRHGKMAVGLDDLRKGNEFGPSGLFVRTEVLKQVMFDENLRHGEDWDVLIRIALRCSVGYVSDPLLLYSDGSHGRVTNEAKNQSPQELEKRIAIFDKHREFFGPFWFRVHVAATLLSYFWHRKEKLEQLGHAIRRCGILPVAAVFVRKLTRSRRRLMGRA